MSFFTPGMLVEDVATLKSRHAALNHPGLYAKGGEKPYNGLVAMLPATAKFYAIIPQNDDDKVALAKRMLKGLRRPKKVTEIVCEKDAVNYDQFSEAGKVILIYV